MKLLKILPILFALNLSAQPQFSDNARKYIGFGAAVGFMYFGANMVWPQYRTANSMGYHDAIDPIGFIGSALIGVVSLTGIESGAAQSINTINLRLPKLKNPPVKAFLPMAIPALLAGACAGYRDLSAFNFSRLQARHASINAQWWDNSVAWANKGDGWWTFGKDAFHTFDQLNTGLMSIAGTMSFIHLETIEVEVRDARWRTSSRVVIRVDKRTMLLKFLAIAGSHWIGKTVVWDVVY